MKQLVEINNTTLDVKEYIGQRVITFKDIDKVHNRPEGTAKRNFKSNKKYFIKNEDYFIIHQTDILKGNFRPLGFQVPNRGITLLTESGYLMIAKSLTDDLAWQVQKQLVNTYFKAKEIANSASDTLQMTSAMSALAETMNILSTNIASMQQAIASMQQDISDLKHSQRNRYFENRYPSAWYQRMKPKYELLQDYFHCTRNELYSSIYKELEDTYDIDINQVYDDFCYENHLLKEECYPMNAIEHNTEIRKALELLIDTSLVKFGLQTEDQVKHFKRETLFDQWYVTK